MAPRFAPIAPHRSLHVVAMAAAGRLVSADGRLLMRAFIHRFGRSRDIDRQVWRDTECYTLRGDRSETVYIVAMSNLSVHGIIQRFSHEMLHITFMRLGIRHCDVALDRISNTDAWRRRGCLGGL